MYRQKYNLRKQATLVKTKTKTAGLLSLFTAAAISGCAGGGIGDDAGDRSNRLTADQLEICATYPSENTPPEQVKVDDFIYLTFSQKVDDLSFYPENFELWDQDFNRVKFNTSLLNSEIRLKDDGTCELMKSPGQSNLALSSDTNLSGDAEIIKTHTLRIRPQALQSFQTYVAQWRSAAVARRAGDQIPGVVAAATGAELEGNSLKFSVGDKHSGFNSNRITASIRPGMFLDRISNISQSFSLDYLINGSGLVTLNRRAPITIEFKEPVIQVTHDVDPDSHQREMSPTSLRNYPGLAVYVLDANTDWNSLYDAISRLDQNSWFTYLASQRLNGTVRSTNGRKTYIFELEAGKTYPDGIGKIIIVAARGFRGIQGNKPTDKDLYVGGFFHSSGFQLPTGFPSLQQVLGGER